MARPADPNAKIDLLVAAEAVFVEHGLDQAKVEEITARAGRSKGAFYLHFDSKETAFRQIVESLLARLAALLAEDSTFSGEVHGSAGAAERFARWREKDAEIFEFMWQNRRVARLLMEGGRSASYTHLAHEFAERCRHDTMQKLEWGRRQRLFREDLDVDMASLVLSGAYDRVVREIILAEKKPDCTALATRLQHLMLGGLAHGQLLSSIVRLADRRVKNS